MLGATGNGKGEQCRKKGKKQARNTNALHEKMLSSDSGCHCSFSAERNFPFFANSMKVNCARRKNDFIHYSAFHEVKNCGGNLQGSPSDFSISHE